MPTIAAVTVATVVARNRAEIPVRNLHGLSPGHEQDFVCNRRIVPQMGEAAVDLRKPHTAWWRRFLRWLKDWFRVDFGNLMPKEKWAYLIWGIFGFLVAFPELWAAIDSDSAPWPTISGTVGEIEYHHPAFALAVAAAIAGSAYSALRYQPERTGVLPDRGDEALPNRTQGGLRLTGSHSPLPRIGAGVYFFVSLVIIGVGTAVAVITTDVTEEHTVGRTIYGMTALLWVIVPSVWAWLPKWGRDIPFLTFFGTVQSLERRLPVAPPVIAAGLAILLIHLVLYPWPDIIPDIQQLHERLPGSPPERAEPAPTAP
jgi:hypothetical protein